MTNNPVQPPLIRTSHQNQALFSDHYLNEILRRKPEWQTAVSHGRALLTTLRALYANEKEQLTNYNKAQLEANWFQPILTQLGHIYEVQATIPGWDKRTKKPDYAFFANDATRQTAVSQQNTADYAQNALALGEVKKMGDQPQQKNRQPTHLRQPKPHVPNRHLFKPNRRRMGHPQQRPYNYRVNLRWPQ